MILMFQRVHYPKLSSVAARAELSPLEMPPSR